MSAEVRQGDVLAELRKMPDESVSCVVTSPPYWSLRKYDADDVTWPGNDPACEHTLDAAPMQSEGYEGSRRWQHEDVSRQETPDAWVKEPVRTYQQGQGQDARADTWETGGRPKAGDTELSYGDKQFDATCSRCGAWRGQLGLEPTPELFVEHTMLWLREVRRVLRSDGVCFVNIGDGYASTPTGNRGTKSSLHGAQTSEKYQETLDQYTETKISRPPIPPGLKPKDLVLMPQRLALAAQADGWWVRSVIIWAKPNAMPESCRDRPTSSYEQILMLTRSARYWWDQEAVREAHSPDGRTATAAPIGPGSHESYQGADGHERWPNSGRNMRDVWTFSTAQSTESHFATFPEELPRRCILAACPREVCQGCGEARVRVVEIAKASATNSHQKFGKSDGTDHGQAEQPYRVASSINVGWSTCSCDSPTYAPGVVLDPFAGTGTTGVVALRLGRSFIGIELSPKYAEMARTKLATWWRKTRLVEPERDAAQPRLLEEVTE